MRAYLQHCCSRYLLFGAFPVQMPVSTGEIRRMLMEKLWKRLRRSEDAQGLVEYALMVLMISVVVIATLRIISQSMHLMYSNADTGVTSASASRSRPGSGSGAGSGGSNSGSKSSSGSSFSQGGGTGSESGSGPERRQGPGGGKGAGNGHGAK
jgi:Flp pilus assembly pilin Flp